MSLIVHIIDLVSNGTAESRDATYQGRFASVYRIREHFLVYKLKLKEVRFDRENILFAIRPKTHPIE